MIKSQSAIVGVSSILGKIVGVAINWMITQPQVAIILWSMM